MDLKATGALADDLCRGGDPNFMASLAKGLQVIQADLAAARSPRQPIGSQLPVRTPASTLHNNETSPPSHADNEGSAWVKSERSALPYLVQQPTTMPYRSLE
jgi:hypothetical protein